MSDNRAVPTVQLETDHLRVTEWRFAPGAETEVFDLAAKALVQ